MGFAFLPEILIRAARFNLKIVEQPIRFVFRTSGESKMHIVPTIMSYLRLFFLHSVGTPALIATCILLLGMGVRIALCFPARQFLGDSDAVLSGLCALDVSEGHFPLFFPGGYRLSSQSCYMAAGMFHIFGPTRAALGATSVLYGLLFLIFGWLALREIAGSRSALPGFLLLAIPSIQFLLVNYPVWGYGETMATSALTLWLGFRLLKPQAAGRWRSCLLFGLAVGFAFWTSPQTLMITFPLCLLLLWERTIAFRRWLLIAAGSLIGLIPYALVIARQGLAPFRDGFATKPVSTLAQFVSNAHYLFDYTLPVLFFSGTSHELVKRADLAIPFLLVAMGYLALLVIAILHVATHRSERSNQLPILFPLLILLIGFGMYIASGAGSVRGWTVRYVAPLYLTIPLTAALLVSRPRSASVKAVASVCAVELAVIFALAYPPFLDHKSRETQIAAYSQAQSTIAWLKQNHIDVVIGDYWSVYSLNFDGLRSVVALPLDSGADYLHFGQELKGREVRAALLDPSGAHLEQWAKRLNEPGNSNTWVAFRRMLCRNQSISLPSNGPGLPRNE